MSKFKRYEWCDKNIAHGRLPLPKRFKHWVCNKFDDYVLRSCVGDEPKP